MKKFERTRHLFPAALIGGLLLSLFLASPSLAAKDSVELQAALGSSYALAGAPRTAYLRVALKGFELSDDRARTPVNLAIVLDRSGSMQGEKLEHAKRAAEMAIRRLEPEDRVSVVVYDTRVQVLAPSAPLTDPERIIRRIREVTAGSDTALFAGVSKGAWEVRKALSPNRVNRVILLSDGLANVGPSSPGELAELGRSLAADGIAVSTIGLGLGYNEELMDRLARTSDGNHFFAERPTDLASIYAQELGEVLSVVAQDVEIAVRFAPGARPVRILGREARLRGQSVETTLNQLYSRQTKYILVELELDAGRSGEERLLAVAETRYRNTIHRKDGKQEQRVRVAFTDRPSLVEAHRDPRVMASVARQVGAERNQLAMRLRDEGRAEEAQVLLLQNASFLEAQGDLYDNKYLLEDAQQNMVDADNLDEEEWTKQRKEMSQKQFEALQALGYVE